MVNLFDSLSHDIIEREVKEQVESSMADSNVEITSMPVQQQQNGSDCGIFAIAFSTCIVFDLDPRDMTFDIPRMRPHLSQCLKDGIITPFYYMLSQMKTKFCCELYKKNMNTTFCSI